VIVGVRDCEHWSRITQLLEGVFVFEILIVEDSVTVDVLLAVVVPLTEALALIVAVSDIDFVSEIDIEGLSEIEGEGDSLIEGD
jgi:hypothetical protein